VKPFIADICIPTYNEEKNLDNCLYHLSVQTLYREDLLNIIIADYKQDHSDEKKELKEILGKYKNITLVNVRRDGIAYARNQGIRLGGTAPNIISFDADSYYNRQDAIEKMIAPLIPDRTGFSSGLLTHCDLQIDGKDKSDTVSPIVFKVASIAYKVLPLTMGQCMAFSRTAFDMIDGFRDEIFVKGIPGEDWDFTIRLCMKFGHMAKVYIPDVVVYTSNRRHKNLANILDYTKDYR